MRYGSTIAIPLFFPLLALGAEIIEEPSYLALKVTVTGTFKTIVTEIGMDAPDDFIHIPVDSIVHRLKPGRYVIKHIDLKRNVWHYEPIQLSSGIEFQLEPNKIHLLGNINIREKRRTRNKSTDLTISYETDIGGYFEVLKESCIEHSALFGELPVSTFGKTKDLKIDCLEVLGGDT